MLIRVLDEQAFGKNAEALLAIEGHATERLVATRITHDYASRAPCPALQTSS